jgi:hypothetical protein
LTRRGANVDRRFGIVDAARPEEDGVAARRRLLAVGSGGHRRLRGIGAAAAAILSGVHLDRLDHAAREATYLGVLFGIAAVSFAWVAVRLLHADDVDGWLVGVALAVAITGGYVLSCTVGLPGLSPEHWSALGDSSTSVAVVLLAAAVARSRFLVSERRVRPAPR